MLPPPQKHENFIMLNNPGFTIFAASKIHSIGSIAEE